MTADKMRLCVSAIMRDAYISAVDKKGFMTNNRRKLERGEVLQFIHEWAEAESARINSKTICVTAGKKTVLEIIVKN